MEGGAGTPRGEALATGSPDAALEGATARPQSPAMSDAADLILAIDVGTQSVRALAFDARGVMHGRAQVVLEPPFDASLPGRAEKDPLAYWQAVVASCAALWRDEGVDPVRIAGLSMTTQRGTVVCAREDGTPLRPAIIWPDQRLASAPPPIGPIWTVLFGVSGARALLKNLQRQAEAKLRPQRLPGLSSC